ncbi:hypothetical protein ACWEKT_08710 [Nocardia takedensis]
MRTERFDLSTSEGRVVGWCSSPDEPVAEATAPIVVLAGGYGQRMRHVGAVAANLVANGAVVYRFDPVRHTGLSDGEMRDFTLGGVLTSMTAVCAEVRSRHDRAITVVAASLSARAAVRLVSREPWFDRLVMLVGVVDTRATISAAFGVDYWDTPLPELPELVEIDRHRVDPRGFKREEAADAWGDADRTIAELRGVRIPVVNFIASDDEWVDADQVRRVFAADGAGDRYIGRVGAGAHRIAANPIAFAELLRRLTAVALCPVSELPAAVIGEADRFTQLGFEDLIDLTTAERALERRTAETPTGAVS